ncbi:MAG: hypothetical protein K2J71_08780 [Oscillospiraceae bacterium]|nr:hypothetical protein [Oscillospiraceae bacterium]
MTAEIRKSQKNSKNSQTARKSGKTGKSGKSHKIEKKKAKPFIQFKLGIMILLILLSFLASFGLYMLNATSDPEYWEREILSSQQNQTSANAGKTTARNKKSVVNPVPLSDRADDTRMSECALIGNVSDLTAYYDTKADLVFTDDVAGMSESRMSSISRNVSDCKAVYLWYDLPENQEETLTALRNLTASIQAQKSSLPIYILTALPKTDLEMSLKTDDWNTALFALADEIGLHYVDISTLLKTNEGLLASTYQDNEILYQHIGEDILTHIAD